jgi:hypothetical protein
MTDTDETERSDDEEPTGAEREELAQEGRLQQTEQEEAEEGD